MAWFGMVWSWFGSGLVCFTVVSRNQFSVSLPKLVRFSFHPVRHQLRFQPATAQE